jgi:hypothetical protein
MSIRVGWTIYTDLEWKTGSEWKEIVYLDPEPAWNMILEKRKDLDYTRCPAVSDHLKNTYIVRSPYNITITYDQKTDSFHTNSLGKEWINTTFFPRFPVYENGKIISSCITIRIKYLFVCDQDMEMSVSDVPLISTPLTRNIKIIPGISNIHRWLRPVDFTFEIQDLDHPLELKRGDPLFAVTFNTKEKIHLEHVELSQELQSATMSCVQSRNYVPNKTLKYRYEMAKRFLFKKKWLAN